jgi:hypothetical protein
VLAYALTYDEPLLETGNRESTIQLCLASYVEQGGRHGLGKVFRYSDNAA